MTPDSWLLRQVHPSWIQRGKTTSIAFKPTKKDNKRLSVYDGDQISPVDSWRHYTEDSGLLSAGVVAVTVGECGKHDLPVEPDPGPFPEHVLIKFDNCSNSQIKNKARYLNIAAKRRGWLYLAEVVE